MSVAFNEWADKNKEKINEWAATIGEKIKNAFVVVSGAIETAFSWIFENWPRIVEVFRKIGSAIDKTVGAVSWIIDKADHLNPFGLGVSASAGGVADLIAQQKRNETASTAPIKDGFFADMVKTYLPPTAQSATNKNNTHTITIQNTINANGQTKEQLSALIDEKSASTWRQVSETLAGSRGE